MKIKQIEVLVSDGDKISGRDNVVLNSRDQIEFDTVTGRITVSWRQGALRISSTEPLDISLKASNQFSVTIAEVDFGGY